MKTQKLVRKYRLLKPNERIQLFDWFTGVQDAILIKIVPGYSNWSSMNGGGGGWVQIQSYDEEQCAAGYLDGPASKSELGKFARFVDCVPAK